MSAILQTKILEAISTTQKITRFTSMPEYTNCVSNTNYELGRLLLKRPNNGCTSFAVYIDGQHVGRIDSEIVLDALSEAMARIKNNLIDSL